MSRQAVTERRVAQSVIADPEQHTIMDEHGGVRSIQAANISMPAGELDRLWTAENLERLARTYWKYLSRVTLGLIRVVYGPTERAVVLITRPFVLLRFFAPEYEFPTADRAIVRWRIRDGILVARRGREGNGYLEIDVRRVRTEEPGRAMVHVEVEVANFYPAIARWLTRFVYTHTQSRIHVIVTHGFLKSLARLELEQSAVGRFARTAPDAAVAEGEPIAPVTAATSSGNGRPAGTGDADREVNVGETPWRVVAALAAGASVAMLLAVRRLR